MRLPVLSVVLLLASCNPPAAPVGGVSFAQQLENGCDSEDECKAWIARMQRDVDTCEIPESCEASKRDLKKAQQNYMDFRERQSKEAAEKEASKPRVEKSKAPVEPKETAADKSSKSPKLSPPPSVPPPPGCERTEDGMLVCPPADSPGTGKTVVPCGVTKNGKPPPGCGAPPN